MTPFVAAPLAALALAVPASAQEGPSPTATPSPMSTPQWQDCAQGAGIRPVNPTITAMQPVEVTVLTGSGTRIDLVATDDRTGGRTVRSGTAGEDGRLVWTLRPVFNTDLYAQRTPEPCDRPVFSEVRGRITVRTALSLTATRNGPRQYTFSGRAFPAREDQLVRLYRKAADGREVLAATTRVTSAGRWRIDRRFTGSGRFNFVARTPADRINAAGVSNVRPTLIY